MHEPRRDWRVVSTRSKNFSKKKNENQNFFCQFYVFWSLQAGYCELENGRVSGSCRDDIPRFFCQNKHSFEQKFAKYASPETEFDRAFQTPD